jgi:hypothetical protein
MVALRTVRQWEGIFFYCDQCGGRAVTIPQVRRVAGDKFATQLLRKINHTFETSFRKCPFCCLMMLQSRHWGAFAVWLLIQLYGVYQQIAGISNVSA